MRAGSALVLALVLALGACGGDRDPAGRGKQVYLANCIACHNSDPAKEGPLGPAVKGSSRELLEARVLQGAYPPGYTPKRPSSLMKPMPNLAPSIPDLAEFLK